MKRPIQSRLLFLKKQGQKTQELSIVLLMLFPIAPNIKGGLKRLVPKAVSRISKFFIAGVAINIDSSLLLGSEVL